MIPGETFVSKDPVREIPELINMLLAAEQRLEELTAGEVDAISDAQGRPFLLRRAQEQLRKTEIARQAAILDALPAHVALLDTQGTIVLVNEAWRLFARLNASPDSKYGVGSSYLEVCDKARAGLPEAEKVGEGIRAVLSRSEKKFWQEYSCDSLTEQRWFEMSVTPLAEDRRNGAVVMHVDITKRKQTENQLRGAHRDFQRLLVHSPAVLYSLKVETDGRLTPQAVSENMVRLLGFKAEESTYDWWVAHIHPEDRARVLASLAKTLERSSVKIQYRMAHKDGHYLWIEDTRKLVRDTDGKPIEIAGAWIDITQCKQTQDDLRESEQRLREMLENLELIAVTLDKAGTVTFCNDYLLKLTGWNREEVIGTDWFAKFVPASNTELKKLFFDTIGIGELPPHYENSILTKTGALREIVWNNTMLRDESGNFIGAATIGEDVTERRHSQESLLESEEELRDLFENANDLILSIAPDGKLLYANRAWREALGYRADEIAELNLLDLIHLEYRQRSSKLLADAAEGQKVQLLDAEFVSKDAKQIVVEGSVSAKRVKDRAVSLRCIFRDVTEKKKLQAQFLRHQRMESIGTLAGGIAHDLNNVLAPILMSVELLRMNVVDPNTLKTLDILATSAQRGADMVRQVLTFSRGVEGQRSEVRVSGLIKDMRSIIQQTFPPSILLRTKVASKLWTVTGDATQLHQVLLNLCVNARDAMPGGGSLTIEAENLLVDEHFARMNPEAKPGPYLVLSVKDNGGGIPLEIIEHIFDPFFTTKTLDNGTGLGLSTVLGIVKSHQGFVSVYSEVGKGSNFMVYLPANSSGQLESAKERSALPMGKGELILVVDDEAAICNISKQTLEMFGYRVLTASDGAQAVAVCARNMGSLDLLLTDMSMPIMDGASTVRAIRALCPGIKVIAASGLDKKSRSIDPDQVGANAFLQKPFTAECLVRTVREILDEIPKGADEK